MSAFSNEEIISSTLSAEDRSCPRKKVENLPGPKGALLAEKFEAVVARNPDIAVLKEDDRCRKVGVELTKDQAAFGLNAYSITGTLISDKCPKGEYLYFFVVDQC